MPILNVEHDKDTIIRMCLGDQDERLICSEQPRRIRKSAAFLLDQSMCSVKHPYDFDGCESLASSRKTVNIRWYQVKKGNESMEISSVITPRTKDHKVVCGKCHDTKSSRNDRRNVPGQDMYALIRRRSEDLNFKKKGSKFIRLVNIVMSAEEYNDAYKKLSSMKTYALKNNKVLVFYKLEGEKFEEESRPHGNSKQRKNDFIPSTHCFKVKCKEVVETSTLPVRNLIDEMEEHSNIFTRTSENDIPRNAKQISNYRAQSNRKMI